MKKSTSPRKSTKRTHSPHSTSKPTATREISQNRLTLTKSVKRNKFSLSTLYHFRRSDDLFTGSHKTSNSTQVSTSFRRLSFTGSYQLTDRLNLSATIPFTSAVRRENGTADKRIEGLGDVSVFTRFSPWRGKSPAQTGLKQLSFSLGITLPTGKDANNPSSGIIAPTVFQLGSGAFQAIAGVSHSHRIHHWNIGSSASYLFALNKSSNGFRPASSFYASVTASRPFLDDYRFGLGLNFSKSGRDEFKGNTLFDTGSTTLSLSPSLLWKINQQVALSTSVEVPIYRKVNRTAIAGGTVWKLGIRVRF